jgi:hypothetical protein
MERDFNNGYMPPFMDYGMPPPNGGPVDINEIYKDPMMNPMMQYDQAFCYYRYLCMQMDYKIKCKEYEKLCGNQTRHNEEKNDRREIR